MKRDEQEIGMHGIKGEELRFLIIEDTPTDAELIVRRLQRDGLEFRHRICSDRPGMVQALDSEDFDLVISDFNLPGFTGLDALRYVKEWEDAPPFILLSGSIDKAQENEVLRLGANEVLMKDNLNRLHFSVRRVLKEAAARQRLEESLQQKQVLLQEVHHRVKNNLAVISSLLQLRQMATDNPAIQELSEELLLKIKSIALVHEKLYQTHDLVNVDLRDLVKDLVQYTTDIIESREYRMELNVSMRSIHINVNQAIPCGLILTELMNNAIRHAFRGEGDHRIHIRAHETNEGERVVMTVKDNGVGVPEDFRLEEGGGLGSTIVSILLEQLGATCRVDNTDGTRITFAFHKENRGGAHSQLGRLGRPMDRD